ncbi:hypothetical protein [Massilia suwonensis]|uniref:Uncharacterized protein n=1 Tax=Massilia suwonensis TaxID=648895 RepID=A0ABW0MEB6_9BURK
MSTEALAAVKQVGDVAAASVTVLTVIKVLPAVAAGFAIIWYSVGLYEKITGRQFSESWLARFLSRK